MGDLNVTRRHLLAGTACGLSLWPVTGYSDNARGAVAQAAARQAPPANAVGITLLVNGAPVNLTIDPSTSVLDALREPIPGSLHPSRHDLPAPAPPPT
jgi:hypothetical protein